MELPDYVKWAREQQPFSRLGFFSQPVMATGGPLEGKMLKVYTSLRSTEDAQRLKALHDEYIVALRATGRKIPETRMELVSIGNAWVPLIIQEAFAIEHLVRQRMERVTVLEEYLVVLERVLADTMDYLEYRGQHGEQPLGFHPTLRNYALQGDDLYYFDTFPPMNLPQQELNLLIRQSLPQLWLKLLASVIPSVLNRVSHEYYDATAMVAGIVGSACRLMPDWASDVLFWSQEYIGKIDSKAIPKSSILEKIQEKPKLSAGWTSIRKLTKNIGKPNI